MNRLSQLDEDISELYNMFHTLSETNADRSHIEDVKVQIKNTAKRDIQAKFESYPDNTKLQDRVGLLEAESSKLKARLNSCVAEILS